MTSKPTLYKKSATGAIQCWTIGTEDNTIVTTWGQVGGAMQTTRDTVTQGKNLGKKNETTPAQQAALEAQAQWEKKLKKGYVQDLAKAEAGEVDDIIEGGVLPMLAHPFADMGHKLVYPCYAQPKLDGHRCVAVVEDDGSVTLWSRTRKPIGSMPHIAKAVADLGLAPGVVLDGELYNHDYKAEFEKLTSLIRASEPRDGHEVMQYHIYDVITPDPWTQEERFGALANLEPVAHPLVLVRTIRVENEDELMTLFEDFLADGYEGAIARNAAGKYVHKRSHDLLKLKDFTDGEFEVVGVEEGRGKLAGHAAAFVCKAANGNLFRAKLKGETAELKKYFEDQNLAVGRMLTVKYQGLTGKNGIPRIPIALRFREDL